MSKDLATLTGTQASIQRLDGEIQETTRQIKVVRDAKRDELAGLDSYSRFTELSRQLKAVEKELKLDIQGNGALTKLMEEDHQLKSKLRGQVSIMSGYLVQYKLETKMDQVPLADNPTLGKMVQLSGKLSKKTKKMQEQMKFDQQEAEN